MSLHYANLIKKYLFWILFIQNNTVKENGEIPNDSIELCFNQMSISFLNCNIVCYQSSVREHAYYDSAVLQSYLGKNWV